MLFSTSFIVPLLAIVGITDGALTTYKGKKPDLPSRKPFGFGIATTGGAANKSAVYVVDNMVDLREALQLNYTRTVYVKGLIDGSVVKDNVTGKLVKTNCDTYIQQAAPQFNFTQYMMSLNTSYMASLEVLPQTDVVEGRNVTEFIDLLKQQVVRYTLWGLNFNCVLIVFTGLGSSHISSTKESSPHRSKRRPHAHWSRQHSLHQWRPAPLRKRHQRNKYISPPNPTHIPLLTLPAVRNIRFSPPRDCFPEPETASAWNAQYDALSLATATNFWVDGNILVDGPKTVARDALGLWGWFVDRYDGLFDCRVGSDNITFSHNIVGNHHKSMLFGGSRNNEAVDVGKMRFTLFGNSIIASESRSPMMRHGTFYLVNNMYTQESTQLPLYNETNPSPPKSPAVNMTSWPVPYAPNWLYNMGIDNFATVLVAGNVFSQAGLYPSDETRIFNFATIKNITKPARVCIPASLPASETKHLKKLADTESILNGKVIDLRRVAEERYRYHVGRGDVIAGGLELGCEKSRFKEQKMPQSFKNGREVAEYIKREAGQVGKHKP